MHGLKIQWYFLFFRRFSSFAKLSTSMAEQHYYQFYPASRHPSEQGWELEPDISILLREELVTSRGLKQQYDNSPVGYGQP